MGVLPTSSNPMTVHACLVNIFSYLILTRLLKVPKKRRLVRGKGGSKQFYPKYREASRDPFRLQAGSLTKQKGRTQHSNLRPTVVWATKYFRCHLYGKKCLIRTDHATLNFVYKFAYNNSRVMRWRLRLNKFDFEIGHVPVIKIKHVGALSRHVGLVE